MEKRLYYPFVKILGSHEFQMQNGHVKGNLEAVELTFSDIRMELKTRKKQRVLLDGSVNGVAKPGRMMAIMGPRYVAQVVDAGTV